MFEHATKLSPLNPTCTQTTMGKIKGGNKMKRLRERRAGKVENLAPRERAAARYATVKQGTVVETTFNSIKEVSETVLSDPSKLGPSDVKDGGIVNDGGGSLTLEASEPQHKKLVESCLAGAGVTGVKKIEGFDEATTGSPWLLVNTGNSQVHNDISEICHPNSPTTWWSLVVCITCEHPYQMRMFNGVERATPTTDHKDFQMSPGSYMIFPSKFMHQAVGRGSRTVVVITYHK